MPKILLVEDNEVNRDMLMRRLQRQGFTVCFAVDGPSGVAGLGALAEDIVRWSLEQMAYYKAPGWICFVDQLPLTATEKIQRGGLKEFVAKLMHDGAFFDLRDLKRRQV